MKTVCTKRSHCRLCKGSRLENVLTLVPTPPANALVTQAELDLPQEVFPLELYFCQDCSHLQLLHVVDPEVLFRNYVYVSGTSPAFVAHFQRYAKKVAEIKSEIKSARVVEIGSNDGTLLKEFKALGFQVVGIDPAIKIAEEATRNGIPTLPDMFNATTVQHIRDEYGMADVVVANNVFAHIDALDEVAKNVRALLKPDGIFVFEVSYLVDVLAKTLFDTIYHEHLSYHSVTALVPFFEACGLPLRKVERVDTHGGSLRGYCSVQDNSGLEDGSVAEFLMQEARLGINQPKIYREFQLKIDALGRALRDLIQKIKRPGSTLVGFGAPAKATTLMYQFGLTADDLSYIVDDSPWKQGLFTPGLHVPICSADRIHENPPEYIIILAWNFADSIREKNASLRNKGVKFIVPLPKLEVF